MIRVFRAAAAGNAFGARVALVSTANSRGFSSKGERSDLVGALDNEIKLTQLLRVMPAVPGDFPFKFKDPGFGGGPYLSKKFGDEEIGIMVREFKKKCDDDDDTNTVELKVDINKGYGRVMNFVLAAPDDQILIQRLSTSLSHDDLICSHLYIKPESEMQVAMRDFLETRGIRKSVIGFLRHYLVWKTKVPWGSGFRYSPSKKFNQQNVDTLTKLKEIIHAW